MVSPLTPFKGPRHDLVSLGLPNPGVSMALFWTVPDKTIVELVTVNFLFTTAAVVADRFVQLEGFNGVQSFSISPAMSLQPASLVWYYFFAKGSEPFDNTANGRLFSPLTSPLFLVSGEQMKIHVISMQAGDALTSCAIRYFAWQEG